MSILPTTTITTITTLTTTPPKCAWLIATTVLVGVLLGADVLLAVAGVEVWRPFGVSLALLAAMIGGGRVVSLALAALFEGRVGADIALAIACVAAGWLGEYFVAAEVVFIALVGECLEAFTFERAQRAIQKLLEYRPRTARVLRDGREIEVEAEALAVGDVIVVRPGERIAADGTVIGGRSVVDQAVLTGEAMPVDKGEGIRSTPARSTSSADSRSAPTRWGPRRRSGR